MGRQPKPNPLPKSSKAVTTDRGFEAAASNAVDRAAAAAIDAQLRREPSGAGLIASREHHHTLAARRRGVAQRNADQYKQQRLHNGMGATQSLSTPRPDSTIADAKLRSLAGACALCGGLSFALLNLCSFFKGVDDSVLPAVYLEVSTTIGIGPQELGVLTMIASITVGVASPISGWLGTRYSRPHLIGYGCFIWSIGAAGMAACDQYWQLIIARAVNGWGLGMIGPLMFGMVVDAYASSQRGQALAILGITGSIGGLLGGWFATTVGSLTILGFAGWRFPLYVVAVVGVLVGVLVFCFTTDPGADHQIGNNNENADPARKDDANHTSADEWSCDTFRAVLNETRECFRIPTFWVVVAQGVFGSTPWAAWGFSTLWLQLICFESDLAANIRAMFTVGTIFGTLFGGWLGDYAARKSEGHGRPWVAVVSVGGGVPMTYVILRLLPQATATDPAEAIEEARGLVYLWGTAFFIYGFWIVWVVGVNGPIFSEIVAPKYRSYIYSLDAAFELSFSSIGGPLSGYIASRSGFIDENTEVCDRENGEALATGMLWVMTIPWTVCTCCYCILHLTYPRDRQRVMERAAQIAAEEDGLAEGEGLGFVTDEFLEKQGRPMPPRTRDGQVERQPLPSPWECACKCWRTAEYAPLAGSVEEEKEQQPRRGEY